MFYPGNPFASTVAAQLPMEPGGPPTGATTALKCCKIRAGRDAAPGDWIRGDQATTQAPNKTLAIVRRHADTSTTMETNSKPAPAPRAESDQRLEGDGKVIPFRPRQTTAAGGTPGVSNTTGPEDLAKYEQGDGEDDFRHRMIMNAAAIAVTVVLAAAGAWLAITIGDMRKNQDCYLSGRRNCTPIDVPSLQPKAQPR